MVEQSSVFLDSVFHALADPTRRAMLRQLSAGEHNIRALAEPYAMSFAAASKHVKVLENAGLVDRHIQGRSHICRLNPQPLRDAEQWLAYYEGFWSQRLDHLESLLIAEDDIAASSQRKIPAKKSRGKTSKTKPRGGKHDG